MSFSDIHQICVMSFALKRQLLPSLKAFDTFSASRYISGADAP